MIDITSLPPATQHAFSRFVSSKNSYDYYERLLLNGTYLTADSYARARDLVQGAQDDYDRAARTFAYTFYQEMIGTWIRDTASKPSSSDAKPDSTSGSATTAPTSPTPTASTTTALSS